MLGERKQRRGVIREIQLKSLKMVALAAWEGRERGHTMQGSWGLASLVSPHPLRPRIPHVPASLCRGNAMLEHYLVYSLSLPTNGVIIQSRAGRALMPGHVNTHQVQILRQELQKQTRGGYGAGELLRRPRMETGDHGWERGGCSPSSPWLLVHQNKSAHVPRMT